MKAISNRELRRLFRGWAGWAFLAVVTAAFCASAWIYNVDGMNASLSYAMLYANLSLILASPLLAMDAFASETRAGVNKLLRSLPIRPGKVVAGKYLAMLVPLALACALMLGFALLFTAFGAVSLVETLCSLAAFFALGAATIALSLFAASVTRTWAAAGAFALALSASAYLLPMLSGMSAMARLSAVVPLAVVVLAAFIVTRSFVAALAVGVLAEAPFFVARMTQGQAASTALQAKVTQWIALFDRAGDTLNGVFDMTALIYLLSAAAMLVFFATLTYASGKYEAGRAAKK